MTGIINDILCFVQNNFINHPKNNLLNTISNFYKEDEIVGAKNCLYAFVDSLSEKPEGISRNVKRQAGDNKRKLDSEDLLNLYSVLDAAKIKLPRYTVANLRHIPSINAGEVDLYALAATVNNLNSQFDLILNRLSSIESMACKLLKKSDFLEAELAGSEQKMCSEISNGFGAVNDTVLSGFESISAAVESVHNTVTPYSNQLASVSQCLGQIKHNAQSTLQPLTLGQIEHKMQSTHPSQENKQSKHQGIQPIKHTNDKEGVTAEKNVEISDVHKSTWAMKVVNGEWKNVNGKRRQSIKVKGTRPPAQDAESAIKAIPRKDRLYAYVGRLEINTKEEELVDYLKFVGIINVRCKRLKVKNGAVQDTAAFFVSCDAESREIFYDESYWPDGAELRDWVFYN